MKALVTGSAGFVGRYMVQALVDRGYEVFGIDINPWVGTTPFGYKHAQCDCREYFKVKDYDHQKYDLVVHLAAIVGGRNTIEYEPLRVATDLSIDAEMFNWAIRSEQDRVVYYSSSAAYPTYLQESDNVSAALHEDHIDVSHGVRLIGMPDQTYGWSKLTGEMLAQHAQLSGTRVNVFRPFSGYGSDQSLDYPFPSLIKRVTDKCSPFRIWSDGTQTRDWIHIEDIVEATLTITERDCPTPINLCTGRGISFNDLASLMFDIAIDLGIIKSVPEIEHILDAPRGVTYRVGNPSRMNLFYTPRISLEEGIRQALLTMMRG